MTEDTPEIVSFGCSGVGNIRQDNQDAMRFCRSDDLTDLHGHLYGIADGMGGYAHGAVASSLALELFFETYYKSNGASVKDRLRSAVQNANVGVYQAAQRMGAGRMGTTLTAVSLVGSTLSMAHVGDSRAYMIRERRATLLTNDHTQVGDMVRMRLIGPEKVRTHSQRSVLNKCLGVNLFITPDITRVQVQSGDVIVLCTDGVWSVIEDHEFAEWASHAEGPEDLCKRVFDIAMERESDDNLSVIALFLRRIPSSSSGDSSFGGGKVLTWLRTLRRPQKDG
ncbi:MAG TPA: protein phosphatase 2C domain-containing protein [Bacteroidota bacterium]|nr:protein phosphatase 2C domain-containing protein [Bacteroidota bacterium]